MSVILNPDIGQITPDSPLEKIYKQLYQAFFDAQDKKSKDNPFGIEEGDETSIRLKNTAYTFAFAIATSGGSGEGGYVDLNYLKLSGGSMTGALNAHNGFSAGAGNSEIVRLTQKEISGVLSGVMSVIGKIEIESDGLLIDGVNVLSYNEGALQLNGQTVNIATHLVVGGAKDGLSVSSKTFKYKDLDVYHAGNSNGKAHNWAMKDAKVYGSLGVDGVVTLSGKTNMLADVSVKHGEDTVLSVVKGVVKVSSILNIASEIVFDNKSAIQIKGGDITILSENGRLNLGGENTKSVCLGAGLFDHDGANVLINKFGTATFKNGFSASHDYSEPLIRTYRNSNEDEGVIFSKNIVLGVAHKIIVNGSDNVITITSKIDKQSVQTSICPIVSESYHAPKDKVTYATSIGGSSSIFQFELPIEVKDYIGISKSSTRLTKNSLFFKDNSQLISVADGIKHYGNSYLLGSVSSEQFASGFSGYGWAILNNKTTGSYNATFDELTIRKKMRVYELEVQKISATNGSLWVSDACSGDTVQKL